MFLAGSARPFSLRSVATLMDSRIQRNPGFADLSVSIPLAEHVMGEVASYERFGVVGPQNSDVHMKAAQSVLRRQHPALLGDLHEFIERFQIGQDARVRAFDRAAIEAEAEKIRTAMSALEGLHSIQIDVSTLDPEQTERFITAAMTLLGITPMDPNDFYVKPGPVGG